MKPIHADEARRRSAIARDKSGELQAYMAKLWDNIDNAIEKGWVGYRTTVHPDFYEAVQQQLLDQMYVVHREGYGVFYISWPELKA